MLKDIKARLPGQGPLARAPDASPVLPSAPGRGGAVPPPAEPAAAADATPTIGDRVAQSLGLALTRHNPVWTHLAIPSLRSLQQRLLEHGLANPGAERAQVLQAVKVVEGQVQLRLRFEQMEGVEALEPRPLDRQLARHGGDIGPSDIPGTEGGALE